MMATVEQGRREGASSDIAPAGLVDLPPNVVQELCNLLPVSSAANMRASCRALHDAIQVRRTERVVLVDVPLALQQPLTQATLMRGAQPHAGINSCSSSSSSSSTNAAVTVCHPSPPPPATGNSNAAVVPDILYTVFISSPRLLDPSRELFADVGSQLARLGATDLCLLLDRTWEAWQLQSEDWPAVTAAVLEQSAGDLLSALGAQLRAVRLHMLWPSHVPRIRASDPLYPPLPPEELRGMTALRELSLTLSYPVTPGIIYSCAALSTLQSLELQGDFQHGCDRSLSLLNRLSMLQRLVLEHGAVPASSRSTREDAPVLRPMRPVRTAAAAGLVFGPHLTGLQQLTCLRLRGCSMRLIGDPTKEGESIKRLFPAMEAFECSAMLPSHELAALIQRTGLRELILCAHEGYTLMPCEALTGAHLHGSRAPMMRVEMGWEAPLLEAFVLLQRLERLELNLELRLSDLQKMQKLFKLWDEWEMHADANSDEEQDLHVWHRDSHFSPDPADYVLAGRALAGFTALRHFSCTGPAHVPQAVQLSPHWLAAVAAHWKRLESFAFIGHVRQGDWSGFRRFGALRQLRLEWAVFDENHVEELVLLRTSDLPRGLTSLALRNFCVTDNSPPVGWPRGSSLSGAFDDGAGGGGVGRYSGSCGRRGDSGGSGGGGGGGALAPPLRDSNLPALQQLHLASSVWRIGAGRSSAALLQRQSSFPPMRRQSSNVPPQRQHSLVPQSLLLQPAPGGSGGGEDTEHDHLSSEYGGLVTQYSDVDIALPAQSSWAMLALPSLRDLRLTAGTKLRPASELQLAGCVTGNGSSSGAAARHRLGAGLTHLTFHMAGGANALVHNGGAAFAYSSSDEDEAGSPLGGSSSLTGGGFESLHLLRPEQEQAAYLSQLMELLRMAPGLVSLELRAFPSALLPRPELLRGLQSLTALRDLAILGASYEDAMFENGASSSGGCAGACNGVGGDDADSDFELSLRYAELTQLRSLRISRVVQGVQEAVELHDHLMTALPLCRVEITPRDR